MQFLRVLVYHYLTIRHADRFADALPALDYDASATEKMDDSFRKYYTRKRKQHEASPKAYKLRGPSLPDHRIAVIEGAMPVKAVLQKAHEYGATMTVFCAALLMCSIEKEMAMRHKKRRSFWRCRSTCAAISPLGVPAIFSASSRRATISEKIRTGWKM